MTAPGNSRSWEPSWILTERTTLADCAADYEKGEGVRTQATNEARATRAKHPRRTASGA
jgi:hypothetical protein